MALSRRNTTAKFVRNILQFYGNGNPNYFLYTDSQAAEHIATQPNMNEHSRSIDIRHHVIRQDYINGEMRIGGVASQANTSDILTKNLQPPLHLKHIGELHITNLEPPPNVLTNCVVKVIYDNPTNPCLPPPKPTHIYSHGRVYTVNPTLVLDPKTNHVVPKCSYRPQDHMQRTPPTSMSTTQERRARHNSNRTNPHPPSGPSHQTHQRKFEQTLRRGETKKGYPPRKQNFDQLQTHTKTHTIRRKVRKSKHAKMGNHTDLQPNICPKGHISWTKTNNKFKSKKNKRPSQNSSTQHTSDRICPDSRLQGPLQNCKRPTPDEILFPSPPIPPDHNSRMCSQKHFLDKSQDAKSTNRTKMGPNTRIEAIRDTQDDILTSLKRISRYTTDVNTKKLYAMSYDDFNRKQTALPRYKRLCDRTIRVTMNGQMLAPRSTKHEYHYRLFGDLQEILQYEHDRLLEIEEAMDSLRDLHEFRQKQTFQPVRENERELKPVKNRPPTPATATLLRLKDIIDLILIPSPSPECPRSLTSNSITCLTFWIFLIRFIFERTYRDDYDNRQPSGLPGICRPITRQETAAAAVTTHVFTDNTIHHTRWGEHDIQNIKYGYYQYILIKNTFEIPVPIHYTTISYKSTYKYIG